MLGGGVLAALFLVLLEAYGQSGVESNVVVKGDSHSARSIEEVNESSLNKKPLDIRIKEWVSASSADHKGAKLTNLTITLEESNSSSLHGSKTITRIVVIGSRPSIRNISLGDIMDKLSSVPEPLDPPTNRNPKKNGDDLNDQSSYVE
jgi:hypothetical protein